MRILEIAGGTGQHALHFSREMPGVTWQTSDRDLQEYGLAETVAAAGRDNLPAPIELDVTDWPPLEHPFDAVYSANCIHIMPEENLAPYVAGVASSLDAGGKMMLYGPFRYGGAFTTDSNARFDSFLRDTYPGGGIRDFETVDTLARQRGLELVSDTAMPANNQFIVWRKPLP